VMSDVLVLNSTYEPLNVTSIARAVRLIFAGKAEVLHDRGRIASPTIEFPLPSIVRMLYFIRHRKKRVALTKKNVLLRDDYACAYCGKRGDRSTMTVDHVVPRRQGGRSEWTNLVAACVECNGRKRDRTPLQAQMPLRRKPHEPRYIPFFVVRRNTERDEWIKYLTLYSVSIEQRLT
jgi:5-methylcytosine-specific restriction endonuclease McrA